jgi:hypothetical protein
MVTLPNASNEEDTALTGEAAFQVSQKKAGSDPLGQEFFNGLWKVL